MGVSEIWKIQRCHPFLIKEGHGGLLGTEGRRIGLKPSLAAQGVQGQPR